MKRWLLLFLMTSSLLANAQRRIYDEDFKELINRMEGIFDNQDQAAQNKEYFPIVLHMTRIWKEKKPSKAGYWLYIEQALADEQQKPYRQRIYHVFRKDNETLVSQVYEIINPLRYAGFWASPDQFDNVRKDSLIIREGCDVYLKMNDDGDFWGSTDGKYCLSSLKGAAYATSEVVVYPNMMVSWDRGYNLQGEQVWGAEKGGYRFRKWTMLRTRSRN